MRPVRHSIDLAAAFKETTTSKNNKHSYYLGPGKRAEAKRSYLFSVQITKSGFHINESLAPPLRKIGACEKQSITQDQRALPEIEMSCKRMRNLIIGKTCG